MEIAIIVIMVSLLIFLLGAIIMPTKKDREINHILTVRLLEGRDPSIGPEGYRDGEIKDIIWVDHSMRKVRWDQAYGSWRLVK
jgi:hypothetical protein